SDSVRILIDAFQKERDELEAIYLPKADEIERTGNWNFQDFDECPEEAKYLIAKEIGLKYSELERLNELRNTEKSKFFSLERLDLTIWNEGDRFSFQKNNEIFLPKLKLEEIQTLPKSFDKDIVYLDTEKIVGNLRIRFWQEGDRIASIGVPGSQLISDIIKDAKIPSSDKKNVFVVEDELNLHWCVGLKIGRLAVANEHSKNILRVQLMN
ncbi:MAG: tRNA lysidine(34) synthetase TilS, partial [Bacteroidota bacterium]